MASAVGAPKTIASTHGRRGGCYSQGVGGRGSRGKNGVDGGMSLELHGGLLSTGTETGVLNSRPKLLRFHISGPAPTPKCQRKMHGEGRKKRFITRLRTCHGKGRVSTQLIFIRLRGTEMSYRFK
jgi:hypothetical protein